MISTNTVLLIYHHRVNANAQTIIEHIQSFKRYSSFSIIPINIINGFPRQLKQIEFSSIILHYSLFGNYPFRLSLSKSLTTYIASSSAAKIYFFQDEMHFVSERFKALNHLGVDVIYSLMNEKNFDHYVDNTNTKIVKRTLTGYVSDDLIQKSKEFFIPFAARPIDVGYRARNLPFYFGRGAKEKSHIAELFLSAVQDTSLNVDISTQEHDRIYGDDWYRFIANSKFMLGVMAGTSIFDFTGEVKRKTETYLKQNPKASFEEVEREVLLPYEGNLVYRTISPRLFESAAFKVCMILFRDSYQGILKAGRHYIPLEKDYSNIDEVLQKMSDSELVQQITENAYNDLILSGNYHYKKFIHDVDQTLTDLGCKQHVSQGEYELIQSYINKDARTRYILSGIKRWLSRLYFKFWQIINHFWKN